MQCKARLGAAGVEHIVAPHQGSGVANLNGLLQPPLCRISQKFQRTSTPPKNNSIHIIVSGRRWTCCCYAQASAI